MQGNDANCMDVSELLTKRKKTVFYSSFLLSENIILLGSQINFPQQFSSLKMFENLPLKFISSLRLKNHHISFVHLLGTHYLVLNKWVMTECAFGRIDIFINLHCLLF